jgi:multiple sugar transport system substrate-binding protein
LTRCRIAAVLAMLGAVAGGCGGGGAPASLSGTRLTVWNAEYQPDRMAATARILAAFTRQTGVETTLVPIPEDGLAPMMSKAAAAHRLPDAVLSIPADRAQAYAEQGIFDAEAAQAVVDELGSDTFSTKALDIVSRDGKATGVPSDGWGQLLIYRKDLFAAAGLRTPHSLADIRAAAERLDRPGRRGIALATTAGDGFTAETFEHVALAEGCELVGDDGAVTFDTPPCVGALRVYGELARGFSAGAGQDVDSTRAAYFSGRAAMLFWSPFLLDAMAGLRTEIRPTCRQCRRDRSFLATHSGLVGPLAGPGGRLSQFGSISTFDIVKGQRTAAAKALVEFMMGEGYTRWLGLAPQGKYPVRFGDRDDPSRFVVAWEELPSGDTLPAPLSDYYSPESIASLGDGVQSFQRWGFRQGQGALIGALGDTQPVAAAVAAVVGGTDPAVAAAAAQRRIEAIKATLK